MKIRPLNDKVAVKFIEVDKEEKTQGGIVLPDTAKKDEKKPQQGEIIAVGSKCCEEGEPKINVGDMVIFDRYAGSKIELDDEEYIILDIDDVLAVLEE